VERGEFVSRETWNVVNRSLNGLLQHLRKASALQTNHASSDCELLERFVESHDEAAFMALIERHGLMVFGVCRRALPNSHDAEDACQAVFIVLARKAASVRKKASLGSWLHGVAYRVAVTLKRDQARRNKRERSTRATTPRDPAAEVTWREVQFILDEELQRLPERLRAPLILCYLECLTRDEAAAKLRLSAGALHGRLERARSILRERLGKRGLTLSSALSAAALGENVVQAAIPPMFLVSSTKVAMLIASGQPLTKTVVATNVLILAKEVLTSMFITKLKLGTIAVLCAGLVLTAIGGFSDSQVVAQDSRPGGLTPKAVSPAERPENDAEFIRRISKDLRGTEPSPAEQHFFVASKEAGKRQKLVDLFIVERQAKKELADQQTKEALLRREAEQKQALLEQMLKIAEIAEQQKLLAQRAAEVQKKKLLLEELQKVREAAARTRSVNNLKQIGLAMHNYHDTYGHFPPAAICDKNGKPLLSWRVALLPYIEQNNLYQQFKLDEPWDSEHNKALAEIIVKTYVHPGQTEEKMGLSHYRLFHGKEAMFDLRKGRRLRDITDGTSNTIMVVEAAEGVPWTKPDDFAYDAKKPLPKFGAFSKGGFNALMGDGSVKFVSSKASAKALRVAITANAGDIHEIGDDLSGPGDMIEEGKNLPFIPDPTPRPKP
jgi:RNA polymerase sigma factor (sigma-70 family)